MQRSQTRTWSRVSSKPSTLIRVILIFTLCRYARPPSQQSNPVMDCRWNARILRVKSLFRSQSIEGIRIQPYQRQYQRSTLARAHAGGRPLGFSPPHGGHWLYCKQFILAMIFKSNLLSLGQSDSSSRPFPRLNHHQIIHRLHVFARGFAFPGVHRHHP